MHVPDVVIETIHENWIGGVAAVPFEESPAKFAEWAADCDFEGLDPECREDVIYLYGIIYGAATALDLSCAEVIDTWAQWEAREERERSGPDEKPQRWVILALDSEHARDEDGCLDQRFWSDDLGWTGYDDSVSFTYQEALARELPAGGLWVRVCPHCQGPTSLCGGCAEPLRHGATGG